MASFAIGDFTFDIISHERVIIGATVEERFVVEASHLGQPLAWSSDRRGSNRELFKFVGKLVVDVYDDLGVKVGTKRGADFRSSLHRTLFQRAEAFRTGVRMGRVADAVVAAATSTLRDALKTRSLDEAVEELTGSSVVTRTEQPKRQR